MRNADKAGDPRVFDFGEEQLAEVAAHYGVESVGSSGHGMGRGPVAVVASGPAGGCTPR